MATEDVFNGAKNALTFYLAYFNTVAQDIGTERALALQAKACETMGAMQGKMMKGQAGIEEVDATAAHSLVKAVPESLGILGEVVEESPATVRTRWGRCSVYDAAQVLGLNQKTTASFCHASCPRLMNAAVSQLNPRLSYELPKYRSAADDFCEEQIVLR